VQRVCHEGSTAEDAYRGLLRYEVGRLEHPDYTF
jgi:hypothetical protein